MAVKKLLQIEMTGGSREEEQILRGANEKVVKVDDNIAQVIEDMRDTMWDCPFCVGLSAPQIGYNYQISIVNVRKESRDEDLIMINPRIVSLSGKKNKRRESCMSVWGLMGDVPRKDKLTIEYFDVTMNLQELTVTGYESRAIQHELDHLIGIVYVDKLSVADLSKAEFFDTYERKTL